MSELGLPRPVESLLSTLKADGNVISSWKVTGEEKTAIIILRVTPAREHTTTHGLPQEAVGHWRKKSPSETRRDIQRASHRREQHQKELQNAQQQQQLAQQKQQNEQLQRVHEEDNASTTKPTTHIPQHSDYTEPAETSAAPVTNNNNNNQESMETEDNHSGVQPRVNCDTSPAGLFTSCHDIINETSGSDTSSVSDCAVDTSVNQQLNTCTTDAATRQNEEDTPIQAREKTVPTQWVEAAESRTQEMKLKGVLEKSDTESEEEKGTDKVEKVKQHVGSVTDRFQQRLLRDTRRNYKIHKFVRKQELVLGESDDFVIYHNPSTNDWGFIIKCLYFSKQKCLTTSERKILTYLHNAEQSTNSVNPQLQEELRLLLSNATYVTRSMMG